MARILVCDDDPDILRLFAGRLERNGHEVLTAADGNEAVRLGIQEGPDLIVLDWMMPGKTGPEVCAEVRAHPRSRDVKVLVLMVTARSQESDLQLAFEVGVDDYLVKPVRASELQERVDALLQRGE